MAKTVEKLEQEIANVEQNIAAIKEEANLHYRNYFQKLATIVQRQLVLCAYQICTQIYPDRFLKIAFQKRQELQQKLQEIGKAIAADFLSLLDDPSSLKLLTETQPMFQVIKKLSFTEEQLKMIQQKLFGNDENEEGNFDKVAEALAITIAAQEQTEDEDEDEDEKDEDEEGDEAIDNEEQTDSSPRADTHLNQWLPQIEKGISKILYKTSLEANKLLKEFEILPPQLPLPVLATAIRAEEGGGGGSPPNLLSFSVETEGEKSRKEGILIQATVIRLRLAELEFGEPVLAVERDRLRKLALKVNQVYKQYQKLQKEKAIAQAETAWRSSWYDQT